MITIPADSDAGHIIKQIRYAEGIVKDVNEDLAARDSMALYTAYQAFKLAALIEVTE